jgi:hypothetical protein
MVQSGVSEPKGTRTALAAASFQSRFDRMRRRAVSFCSPADIRRILPTAVEIYKRETQEVVRRFLLRRVSFSECVAALDAALAGLLPKLTPEQFDEVRAVMLSNNDRVMDEMARRAANKPNEL